MCRGDWRGWGAGRGGDASDRLGLRGTTHSAILLLYSPLPPSSLSFPWGLRCRAKIRLSLSLSLSPSHAVVVAAVVARRGESLDDDDGLTCPSVFCKSEREERRADTENDLLDGSWEDPIKGERRSESTYLLRHMYIV